MCKYSCIYTSSFVPMQIVVHHSHHSTPGCPLHIMAGRSSAESISLLIPLYFLALTLGKCLGSFLEPPKIPPASHTQLPVRGTHSGIGSIPKALPGFYFSHITAELKREMAFSGRESVDLHQCQADAWQEAQSRKMSPATADKRHDAREAAQ